jgi:hypothetical protein
MESGGGNGVAGDATWFPADLNSAGTALTFTRTDRTTIEALGAVGKSRWDTSNLAKVEMPLSALEPLCEGPPPKINFIWHTAYCCSTLLTQVLDKPGLALSLREPNILLDLAHAKRLGQFTRRESERAPDIVFRLLARPLKDRETVTVKPAPSGNNLIRDAALLTRGKSLFLYTDLPSFLISIALDGEVRRAAQRKTFYVILVDGHDQQRWNPRLVAEMSDLQIAALVWHMHMAEFQRAWPLLAMNAAVASLDCDAFLASPELALARLDEYFGLELGAAHVADVMSGPLFHRHAKRPEEAFTRGERKRLHDGIADRLREDVAAIVAWSYDVCRATPREIPLPNPLLPVEKTYL